jgi:hypothetical protein
MCFLQFQELMSQAKFTLSAENSATKDYLTEKFFEPLSLGSVPIVYGAPNIMDISPGPQAIINAHEYECVVAL